LREEFSAKEKKGEKKKIAKTTAFAPTWRRKGITSGGRGLRLKMMEDSLKRLASIC